MTTLSQLRFFIQVYTHWLSGKKEFFFVRKREERKGRQLTVADKDYWIIFLVSPKNWISTEGELQRTGYQIL